jgi:hypothetical protein
MSKKLIEKLEALRDTDTCPNFNLTTHPVPPPIPGDEPEELIRAICDCEGPHYVGAQKSCRGLNGIGATGIFAEINFRKR